MGWVSPTSFSDPTGAWTNEPYAYDGSTSSYAYNPGAGSPGKYLDLILTSAVDCDKVRAWVQRAEYKLLLKVYYDSSWHIIYDDVPVENQWVEYSIPAGTKSVSKVRIELSPNWARLYEFEFNEVIGTVFEQINSTTYGFFMPSGDLVEIGNIDSLDFQPHLKLNRFLGERHIKVGLPVTEKPLPIIDGDKIIWEGIDRHILMYPKAPTNQFELGAYEYEVVLEKKPASNEIILDLQGQGLKFFYQPALTQQEIDEGCFRPDNIVGGYVVYHDSKGGIVTRQDVAKGITTGQAFIIFRPKIIDDNGDWMWEEQYINPVTGKQIITIPQEFLEYAHYPIRHVAGDTFGYETKGGSAALTAGDGMRTYIGTCPSAGTADSLTAYILEDTTDGEVKFAAYKQSDQALHAETAGWDVTEFYDDWKTINTTDGALEATDYFLTIWLEAQQTLYYNDLDVAWWRDTYAYGAWPNPAELLAHATIERSYSIHCDYTPSAAGWTGKISGVTNPTKIMGVATSGITKVKGVT